MYVAAHGLYSSEVIQLRRKFGEWKEDDMTDETLDLKFYEYVEATKLTGDPYVPAGQVKFSGYSIFLTELLLIDDDCLQVLEVLY